MVSGEGKNDGDGYDSPVQAYTPVSVKDRIAEYSKRTKGRASPIVPDRRARGFSSASAGGIQPPKTDGGDVALVAPAEASPKSQNRTQSTARKLKAPDKDDYRDLSARPARIFVGTWNCVYQEPEESVILKPQQKDSSWSDRLIHTAESVSQWLGHVFFRPGRDHGDGATDAGGSDTHDTRNQPDPHPSDVKSTIADVNDSRSSSPEKVTSSWLKGCAKAASPGAVTTVSDGDTPEICSAVDSPEVSVEPSMEKPNGVRDGATGVSAGCEASSSGVPQTLRQAPTVTFGNHHEASTSDCSTAPSPCSRATGKSSKVENVSPRPALARLSRNSKLGKTPTDCPAIPVLLRQSTFQLKPLTVDDEEPLRDWIPAGYDVYIIALQETLSCSMFVSITKYLQRQSKEELVRVPLDEYKLSGYGDGAFLHTKSTSIAVWVRKSLLDSGMAKVDASKAIPLSRINRSKGVVSFRMSLCGQVICVVGCHLPTSYSAREKAATYIVRKLCDLYGGPGSNIDEVFHHVLWTGDFNFRVRNVSAEEALALLNANRLQELLFHDELYGGSASLFSAMKFEEGVVRFYPTYKKRDDRDVADYSREGWADAEYHTRFETQWYKGGNVKERVPSWTDRVLKWSLPPLRTCLQIDEATYSAAQPKVKNLLMTSDHSPVGCGLVLWNLRSSAHLLPRKNLGSTY
ncbi:INOSITOL 5-PHOSPHATASE, putative [Babesia bigemina]|uniref:INOSITOL 5-PHOSPHATASE, putative n=1 Tax=Babesia bigemina TaxID=5866 RepID=A0A061D1L4_BABBI|nr:INOSITOL 5-PHOSPHATASE, putative [Babesia bigemina]CDR94686.1 INOSITOL 5-PHOSPHATASE, putative [Babesia bigemina]|eukprot:XP_012766872.1 INOSITOL 5-PHOSPHATASE, putative [Babesia bigemina]